MISNKSGFFLLSSVIFLSSCITTKKISKYYLQNQKVIDSIQSSFKEQYAKKPFSVEFTDRSFKNISLEIFTDSLKYIYGFDISENRLKDTLIKYHLNVDKLREIINQMKLVQCTWVNNIDYYVDANKKSLVFISFRPKILNIPFTNKKYYILTYFDQPQYYDSYGILLDRRYRKRIRKINDDIFRRITPKVAYTLSDRFR